MNRKTLLFSIAFFIVSFVISSTHVFANNRCSITYKASSGTFSNKKNISKQSIILKVKQSQKRGYAPSIKRKNYVFNGWYTKKKGGKKYTSKTRINKSVKLYPHWLKRYKIQKKIF